MDYGNPAGGGTDLAQSTRFSMLEKPKVDGLVKSLNSVAPVKAEVQKLLKWLDSGFRRNDNKLIIWLFTDSSRLTFYILDLSWNNWGS